MTDMKLQDMKLTDQVAGHENAGHEIASRALYVLSPLKIHNFNSAWFRCAQEVAQDATPAH